MTVAGISGKDGKVLIGTTAIAEVTGWRFTKTANNPSWASSDTGGFKTRVAGVKDGSGSIDFKYSPTAEQHTVIGEGTMVTLILHRNGSKTLTVKAIIDSVSDEVDINDGDAVSGSADFSVAATDGGSPWAEA